MDQGSVWFVGFSDYKGGQVFTWLSQENQLIGGVLPPVIFVYLMGRY